MSEFNINLPSVRLLQEHLRTKQVLEVKMMNGDLITGKLLWQDPNGFFFETNEGSKVFLWLHGVASIRSV